MSRLPEAPLAQRPLAVAIREAVPQLLAAAERPPAPVELPADPQPAAAAASDDSWSVADVLIAGSGADSFGLDAGGTLNLLADTASPAAFPSDPLLTPVDNGGRDSLDIGDLLIAAEAASHLPAARIEDPHGLQAAASFASLLHEQQIKLF